MPAEMGCELVLDKLFPLFQRLANEVWVEFQPEIRARRASKLRITYLDEFRFSYHCPGLQESLFR